MDRYRAPQYVSFSRKRAALPDVAFEPADFDDVEPAAPSQALAYAPWPTDGAQRAARSGRSVGAYPGQSLFVVRSMLKALPPESDVFGSFLFTDTGGYFTDGDDLPNVGGPTLGPIGYTSNPGTGWINEASDQGGDGGTDRPGPRTGPQGNSQSGPNNQTGGPTHNPNDTGTGPSTYTNQPIGGGGGSSGSSSSTTVTTPHVQQEGNPHPRQVLIFSKTAGDDYKRSAPLAKDKPVAKPLTPLEKLLKESDEDLDGTYYGRAARRAAEYWGIDLVTIGVDYSRTAPTGNPSAQTTQTIAGRITITIFDNGVKYGARWMVSTMYHEYIHVLQAKANNFAPKGQYIGNLVNEIEGYDREIANSIQIGLMTPRQLVACRQEREKYRKALAEAGDTKAEKARAAKYLKNIERGNYKLEAEDLKRLPPPDEETE